MENENNQPVNIIKPTCQELTDSSKEEKYDWKICQRCCVRVPAGNKFCSLQCETLFNQRK